MSFFTAPNETALDLVTERLAANPSFAERYEAIADLRSIDDGSLHRGSELRRVASLQGPLADLMHVLDPGWVKDKRKFYAWLDRHPQHCTYDRRKNVRPLPMVTFMDGKEI